MGLFDDKVSIVTGAGRGLGRDYAQYFATDGAAVVVADLNGENAAQTAKEIEASGGRAIGVEADVTSLASVEEMVDVAIAEFGRVDILVNNAGIWGDLEGLLTGILETDPDYWDFVLGVNLKGTFLCTKAAYPKMAENGWGRIVNISSIASRIPSGIYGVSKLAVSQFTFAAATQLGDAGITVNSIAPGAIGNEATHKQIPTEMLKGDIERLPIKRTGSSRDLYGAIKWLCTDDAEWVTGQTIHVNGGAISLM